jgi:superfamily I DNA/RNA helicase
VQRRRAEADPVEQAGYVDHLTPARRHRRLEVFVDDLASADALDRADTWSARAEAARSLLRQLLGAGHRHSHWPEPEQDAFERVEDALTRLGALDELEPHADLAVFARALAAELDAPRGRSGRFGQGVTYAPLSSAAGHDLDAVFVVGCIEGLCPSPRREDAMLPDRARSATDGELEPAALRLHDQHRAFLAALAAAPPGNRTLVAPRGDLRGGRTLLPSRGCSTRRRPGRLGRLRQRLR